MDGMEMVTAETKSAESQQSQGNTITSAQKYVFEQSLVPTRFRNKTLKGYETTMRPDPRVVAMEALRAGRGLFLTGGLGTGKTHLAVACAARLITTTEMKINKITGIGVKYSFQFLPTCELFLELKAAFSLPDGEKSILDKYCSQDLIVLDDVATEKVSEWSRQIFYTMIDRLSRNMKQVIITSNLGLNELSAAIDDRIASRIVEMCTVIKLEGRDRRLK